MSKETSVDSFVLHFVREKPATEARSINYRNPRTSFMFNLAAGGGALLLRKG
jgi:hypothetical protein